MRMRIGGGRGGWSLGAVIAVAIAIRLGGGVMMDGAIQSDRAYVQHRATVPAEQPYVAPTKAQLSKIKHIDHSRPAASPLLNPVMLAAVGGGAIFVFMGGAGLILLGRGTEGSAPSSEFTDADVAQIMAEELAKGS